MLMVFETQTNSTNLIHSRTKYHPLLCDYWQLTIKLIYKLYDPNKWYAINEEQICEVYAT